MPTDYYDVHFLLSPEERRSHHSIAPNPYDAASHMQLLSKAAQVAATERASTPSEWTWLHGGRA